MKKSLFVAGLDFGIDDENLREVFSSFGTVESAKVITDRMSGKSRGFGFVEMSSAAEAEECIKNLHDTAVKGRTIAVKFKEDKPAGGSSQGGRRNY
jgi:RNA recognition motif-containing protein